MAINRYSKGASKKLSKNFMLTEFDCHGAGCCRQTLVDSRLVVYLQAIRDHFGKAVTLNSAYRCATHNKRVGGATASNHVKGMAADLTVKGVSPATVAKYAEHLGVKGIGLYNDFVHIDTRSAKSFWYGHGEQYRSTFGGANPYKEPTVLLSQGDRGNGVKWVQWELNFCGCNCGTVDGIAGVKFDAAVRAFQKKRSLAVDGIVGPLTRAALKAW